MTVPLALAVLTGCLLLQIVLAAPAAARLLRREAAPPPRPRRFWLTLLVGREVCTAGAAAAACWLVLAGGGPIPGWVAAAAAGGAAYLVAETLAPAVGLLLPPAAADAAADALARIVAVLRRPLERPAVWLARRLAGDRGLAPASLLHFAADGAVDEGEEQSLDPPARALLARVRALQQRPVRTVMTPRVRIVAVPVDVAPAVLLGVLREQRFSRVPVHRGERDNVVGILYAKDLLGRDVLRPGFRLEPFLRPPAFVPLGMPAGEVFRELRRRRVHVALVVDEYGGLAGLVTMEDLLEELFGEIRDEYDEAEGA
jgi:CBS domain containing-hemolysin-like protein